MEEVLVFGGGSSSISSHIPVRRLCCSYLVQNHGPSPYLLSKNPLRFFKGSLLPASASTRASCSSLFRSRRRTEKLLGGPLFKPKMTIQEGAVTTEAKSGNMIYESILEEGIFRFDCSSNDRAAVFPSLSFTNTKERDTPITTHKAPSFIPAFVCLLGQQIVKLELPAGTSFYGTGEVSGQLERTGKRVFTWNTDAWGYGPGTTSLYQSHPWVLAVLPTGESLGVLADTTRRCEIDLRNESGIQITGPSPFPVITFGPFTSPVEVMRSLSRAIGTVFMPPKWSLGYHQCRWSYASDERVLEVHFFYSLPTAKYYAVKCCTYGIAFALTVARIFREKDIPCDVIWMDIDYMDSFRCFTFDKANPKSLVKSLHQIGFKAIWMLDPGIKREEGYFVYDSGSKNDVWILKEDGNPFIGEVWPGPCVFPDYTQSKTRYWWAHLVKDFVSNGVDGIWNDMNEPAVFKSVTKTMPESNIHRGDIELGGLQNHSHYHNAYGTLMARSTYEGMKLANENKRPFVLTRAGFIGSQRYAATWTGDNLSNWEHLHMSISMVLQLGLSGQPLAGPDIGGFAGNATPNSSPDQGSDNLQPILPKGIWQKFDFEDSHPDLPTLYLQGGSIIPLAPVHQHTGEANPNDDLTLLVALDEEGKAKGVLFEDDGDGYEFTKGRYLYTHYAAKCESSLVSVDAWGMDGDVVQITVPSKDEVMELVSESEKKYKARLESCKHIPDVEDVSSHKGFELSKTPVELKSGEWALKVVPWIGGRILSMEHLPSGSQWLHSRIDINGYEEYSGREYRSAGCTEEYAVIERDLEHAGEEESLILEGDIGGGLAIQRQISIPKDNPKVFRIDSSIIARKVGAGSGGFSRLVCLRAHPMFTLLHPTESFISFTTVNGSKHEIWPDSGEQTFEGDLMPNGKWTLCDKCLGIGLVSRFSTNEVFKCMIHWGTGTVNLELWSEERPVSKESPLRISHEYEVISIP
ncbi:hypothetical protein CDL15_Pgr028739 [Punica granatum]|uniref:Glycoside hydrolase family 31 N-terminal domain-containing protein n=1 Tax=Punica granatum TaxID=22663 RepID=A0A218VYD5_PUNGR|nr:hypothetical protein CDL15_Pgr028739 [Punica granatum]